VRHRPGFGGGDIGGIAQYKDVFVSIRQESVLVDRREVQFITQPGFSHHLGTLVERDADQQVVFHLALIVGDYLLRIRLDALDHEIRLHNNLVVVQDFPQHLGSNRLGEGAGKRCGIDQFHPVTDSQAGEVPVGKQQEFQRRHGAFDGVFHHVHHQPPALELTHCLRQCG